MANCALTAAYDPPRILVVVVMPGTHVTTAVQKFIVVGMQATHVPYDCDNYLSRGTN